MKIKKWCRFFKESKRNVHDEEGGGRPCLVTDDLKENVNAKIGP
jgi:hypothetical protein